MSIEIPIWVNGKIRWLSGINKKTSCKEVIQALLDEEGTHKAEAKDFVIIERWRKVERPLDENSKILKIWSHWGHEKKEVRFCLRRIDNEVDSGRGSPISNGQAVSLRRKRNRLRSNGKPPWAYRETLHPRRLAELENITNRDYEYLPKQQNKIGENLEFSDDAVESENKLYHYENIYENMQDSKNSNGRKKSYHCSGTGKLHSTPISASESHPKKTKCCYKREHRQKIRKSENIEKLMKLILAQGATIQSQLQKLKEREEQIELLEHERHRERIEKNGRNYLLETYLGSLKDAMSPEDLTNKNSDTEDPCIEISNTKYQHLERGKNNKTETQENGKFYEKTRPGRDDLSNQQQPKSYRSKSETRLQESKAEGLLTRTLSDNALAEKIDIDEEGNASHKTQNIKEELEDLLELKKMQSQIEVWEKVFTINKKLEKEEENLVRLHIKIKKIQTENYTFSKQTKDDTNEHWEESSEPRAENIDFEETDRDRVEIQKSLETLRSDLEHNSKEIYKNFTKLIKEDEKVQQKRNCLSALLKDLERTDHEHNMLSQMILKREKQALEEQEKAEHSHRELGHIESNVRLKISNISVPVEPKNPQGKNTTVFDLPNNIDDIDQRPNLQVYGQERYNFIKPKIPQISSENKIENYEKLESDDKKYVYKETVPVPMGALKSILKNRQNGCNQSSNLNKEFKKNQELQLNTQFNNEQKSLNNSYSQNDPNLTNYTYQIPHLLWDKSSDNCNQTFHDQLSLAKVSEELKTAYSVKPYNVPKNRQTSINNFSHSTIVTTKALVHNDTDSSTSSDTSGLSSMYSSSPTVEEPYVEHNYALDTLV